MRALISVGLLLGLNVFDCSHRTVQKPADPWRAVDPARELVINDLSVVEDATRKSGVWSLGHLAQNAAGNQSAAELMLSLLTSWEHDQTLDPNPWVPNGALMTARPNVRALILDPWLVNSGCAAGATECSTLDFSKAPFRLSAITSRLDKRGTPDLQGNVPDAGEARFVFHALGVSGNALTFTLIFEYRLNATTPDEVQDWAQRWHELGGIDFGDDYNQHLEALTEEFSATGNLKSIRTNEATLAPATSDTSNPPSNKLWQMRSFHVGPTGLAEAETLDQTPLLSLNGTSDLAYLLNQNADAILQGTYVLPGFLEEGAADTRGDLVWTAPGVADDHVLRAFALNTCSGCHRGETNTSFTHIGRRTTADVVAPLSDWLVTQELPRRAADLTALLGGPPPAPPDATTQSARIALKAAAH